jgi:hypothetical protein
MKRIAWMLILWSPLYASAAVPEFAITTTADPSPKPNQIHPYSRYRSLGGQSYAVEDDSLKATVKALGNDQWELQIVAKRDLAGVIFPWQTQRQGLGDLSKEIFYYPTYLGWSRKASAYNEEGIWRGDIYPGGCFAPLVVLADDARALIAAAINWPPKKVIPLQGAERVILRYDQTIPAGSSAVYRALIAQVSGDPARHVLPWQAALDRYREWLDAHQSPPSYPNWMWPGEGYLAIELSNVPRFNIATIEALWNRWKSVFPWIIFWAQQCPYSNVAQSCSFLTQTMDPRFLPALPDFARQVTAAGYHVGYYTIPYVGPHDRSSDWILLDDPRGLQFLKSYFAEGRRQYANSFYVDTLGGRYWGDPQVMLRLFQTGDIPPETLSERVMDIYPLPALVSGSLVSGPVICGAPEKAPEDFNVTTFPRFGRYLLGDRLIYEGQSNNDGIFWGDKPRWLSNPYNCNYPAYCSTQGRCNNGTEREAFLLGAKLDAITPETSSLLPQIFSEHQRVHWWDRRPVYLDTKGLDLSAIPPNSLVDVRRFRDKNGIDLLAVYNGQSLDGLHVGLDGRTVQIPTRILSIVDLGPGQGE